MNTTFKFWNTTKGHALDVLLHGSSQGIVSPFMQKLFNNSIMHNKSVFMFNFPYFERGDQTSSGAELIEERNILHEAINFVSPLQYTLFVSLESL